MPTLQEKRVTIIEHEPDLRRQELLRRKRSYERMAEAEEDHFRDKVVAVEIMNRQKEKMLEDMQYESKIASVQDKTKSFANQLQKMKTLIDASNDPELQMDRIQEIIRQDQERLRKLREAEARKKLAALKKRRRTISKGVEINYNEFI